MTHRLRGLDALAFSLVAAPIGAAAMLLAYRAGPGAAAFAVVGGIIATLAVLRPVLLLYAAVLAIPLELYTLPVGQAFNLTPTKALLILAAVGWVARRIARGELPFEPRASLTKPLALGLVSVVPGLALAADKTLVLKLLVDWTVFFVLYQMIVVDGRWTTVRNLLLALSVTGAVSGVIAIVTTGFGTKEQLIGVGGNATGRAAGEFLSPNTLGVLLAMALPVALALALRGPRPLRPLLLAASALCGVGLVLTLSRGAFLAGAGALGLMLFWAPFRRFALMAILAGTIALVVSAPSFNGGYVVRTVTQRIQSIQTTGSQDPRWTVWNDAINQFGRHPLFGVGGSNFQSRLLGSQSADPVFNEQSAAGVPYSRFPPHAHNIVLNITAELGLVGLVALTWVVVTLVRLLARACRGLAGAPQALAFAVAAAFAALALEGLFDYPMAVYPIAAMVVVLGAAATVLFDRTPGAAATVDVQAAVDGAALPTLAAAVRPQLLAPPVERHVAPARGPDPVPTMVVSSPREAEAQLVRLVERIGREWVESVVALGDGPVVAALREHGYDVRALRRRGTLGAALSAARLRALITRRHPAVVCACGIEAALASQLATRGTGIPVVWVKLDARRGGVLADAVAARCRLVIDAAEAPAGVREDAAAMRARLHEVASAPVVGS